MAGVSDCFTLGSTVWCRTCYNKEIEGEVMAFDLHTKILILKCATAGASQLNDVNFINLALVKELQVKKEVTAAPDMPVSLNLQRLNTRIRNQVEEKKRLLTKMSSNVTPEGQRLFRAIAKTIKEVRWNNNDIIVFDKVTISPPYQLENVRGNVSSREYEYILKVVEKHVKDTALQNQSVNQPHPLNTRIRNQVEEKKRLLTKMSSNVTPEGQRLFRAIAKTIKEVRWNNNDIIAFGKVTISPPYQLENVRGNVSSREYEYILKVVEKHVKDTALQNQSVNQPHPVNSLQ